MSKGKAEPQTGDDLDFWIIMVKAGPLATGLWWKWDIHVSSKLSHYGNSSFSMIPAGIILTNTCSISKVLKIHSVMNHFDSQRSKYSPYFQDLVQHFTVACIYCPQLLVTFSSCWWVINQVPFPWGNRFNLGSIFYRSLYCKLIYGSPVLRNF